MMKMPKKYIEPEVVVLPIDTLSALCASGETTSAGFDGGDEGADPWTALAPGRVPVF